MGEENLPVAPQAGGDAALARFCGRLSALWRNRRHVARQAALWLKGCWPAWRDGMAAAWPRLRRALRALLAFAGTFLLVLLVLTASAGWYTSRSDFCRSCHIMEPYYVSWKESTHKDVPCIKCHFAPGFGEKVRGKMLGLVQLAKYVTRSEGPRPAAEIPDASCLRSGCHHTDVLSGKIDFHGVPFDHRPHLEELRRGKKLRCTSCHSQIVQGEHMTVTESTCFLCHFKEGEEGKQGRFNEGLGACTRCHQIPDQEFDLGGGTKFSHDLALVKLVDCANCHGDLVRGDGEVPRERCRVCHNREDDLRQFANNVFMHKKHVTDHKIDCLDCHLEIRHALDPEKLLHAASDCQSCHPEHHREQVNMLEGIGAKSIPSQTGGMPVARVECRSCHRVKEVSATGTVLWKASVAMCTACHDVSDPAELEGYNEKLKASLKDIEAGLLRAQEALKSKSAELGDEPAAAMTKRLDDLQSDLAFLRAANGIHNVHYARSLTRAILDHLSAACRELGVAEPQVSLPGNVNGLK